MCVEGGLLPCQDPPHLGHPPPPAMYSNEVTECSVDIPIWPRAAVGMNPQPLSAGQLAWPACTLPPPQPWHRAPSRCLHMPVPFCLDYWQAAEKCGECEPGTRVALPSLNGPTPFWDSVSLSIQGGELRALRGRRLLGLLWEPSGVEGHASRLTGDQQTLAE